MKKLLLYISVVSLLIMNIKVVVHADASLPDGTVINNYTKWDGIPPSYTGVDYYDVLVPYAKTIGEIGGQAIGGKDGTRYASSNVMSSTWVSSKVGDHVTLEGAWSSLSLGEGTLSSLKSEKGLYVAVDEKGNEYYLAALGKYFYPQTAVSSGFLPFSSSNRGQMFDVVLTDGTVIHFLMADAKSEYHTNGGQGIEHKGDESGNYVDYYKFANLEYTDADGIGIGQNMFQALNSEVLEIFASQSGLNEFKTKFNINDDGSGNHIAFIRMYKGKYINSGYLRDGTIGAETSYSLGNVTFRQGDSAGASLGSAALSLTGSSLEDEFAIDGMPIRNDMTSSQIAIVLLGRDSLSLNEADTVAIMGSNIELLKKAELLDLVRTIIVFLGMLVIFYSFMLGLGIIFDRANTFIDFSMVTILTLGKVHYDPTEEKCGHLPKGYVTTNKLVVIVLITMLVGLLLVSSGMTQLIGKLLYMITSHFA